MKRICLIILASIVLPALFLAPPAAAQEPRDLIVDFQTGLVAALNDSAGKDFEGRANALCPLLRRTMNIPLQGAASVGRRNWNEWTEEQRDTFLKRFELYLCAAYTDRFRDYSGEEFALVGERDGPRGTKIIETEVRVPETGPIPIDYVLRNSKAGWRVSDLFLDGAVSEVALRRAEFTAVLRDRGFDALVALMGEKIKLWAASAAK